MGFSPGQVHYGFIVTKGMTVECSWSERVIPNFISTVAGQSLKSCSLRATLHAASRSLPLGPSVHTAVPHSGPPGLSALLSCTAILWAFLPAQPSCSVIPHSCPLGLCTAIPHSRPLGLCPRHCHHSSLCSALLQPCSHCTASPRVLGRALYIQSVTRHCPHVCVVS